MFKIGKILRLCAAQINVLAAVYFCLALNSSALAQQAPPVSLLADLIYIEQSSGNLVAKGNVEVFYQGRTLQAAEINYNAQSGTITATGPITIRENNGTVFTADFAELSSDLQNGLIRGARLLLADQLQMSATEAQRTDGRFNTLNRVIASSCQVCEERPVPIWQIRARQIIHDDRDKQIYFKDAQFEVYGMPILYLPYMRLPAPDAKRATGFLFPSFLSSEQIGRGLRIPYYFVISDYSDMTITPTFTFDGAQLVDLEYRQRFKNGGFDFFGGVSAWDANGGFRRGFAKINGDFSLSNRFELEFDGTIVSDTDFMRRFGYDDRDRLVSEVRLTRAKERAYLNIAMAALRSLRATEDNSKIPYVLPELTYRRYFTDEYLSGILGYEFNAVGLVRENGRDVARAGASVDWSIPVQLSQGIRMTGFAKLETDLYRVWDDMSYADRILIESHGTIGAEIRWPLGMQTSNATHVFEPVAQLFYTAAPGWNDDVPNEDSTQVEFDETNLFDLSRYPGYDATETGLIANLGATYTIYSNEGWTLGMAGGVVLRSDKNSQFTQDILGAAYLDMSPGFELSGRFLFDETLRAKRAEAELSMEQEKWDFSSSIVYLAPDPLAGSPVERGEVTLDGSYRIANNWAIDANWTRDLVSGSDVKAEAGITFGNECLEIGLSYSRYFTSSSSFTEKSDVNLTVKLAGFGAKSQYEWAASKCSY